MRFLIWRNTGNFALWTDTTCCHLRPWLFHCFYLGLGWPTLRLDLAPPVFRFLSGASSSALSYSITGRLRSTRSLTYLVVDRSSRKITAATMFWSPLSPWAKAGITITIITLPLRDTASNGGRSILLTLF